MKYEFTILKMISRKVESNFFTFQIITIIKITFFIKFPDKWSPALQIRTVLLSIQALLSAPNPDDPLANDVAELWKVNEVSPL